MTARCTLYIDYSILILFMPTSITLSRLTLNELKQIGFIAFICRCVLLARAIGYVQNQHLINAMNPICLNSFRINLRKVMDVGMNRIRMETKLHVLKIHVQSLDLLYLMPPP